MKNHISIFLSALFLFSCNEKKKAAENISSVTMNITDPSLRTVNGILYSGDHLFTGKLNGFYATKELRSTADFVSGKEQGLSETFYENGEKESQRFYTAGEKDSIHTGWWPGGTKKFEYHFNKGNYNGSFREWYMSGAIAREIMYDNGKEQSGKEWRENGKLYTNFIWKGNRRYGVVNSNLCYGVEKGKIVD